MRATRLILIPLFVLVPLTACSSSSETKGTTTTSKKADTGNKTSGINKDCQATVAAFTGIQTEFVKASTSAYGGGGAVDYAKFAKNLDALVAAAPAEIKADFQVYAEEVGPYLSGLAKLHIDPSKTPSQEDLDKMEALNSALDNEKVQTATNHIQAYFAAKCS